MTFDVITIGSALLDVYLKSDNFLKIPSTKFPDGKALAIEHGGKLEVGECEVCSGGAGTNNAVSFARKGFKTALIAEMGTDLVAHTIKEELKREHVDIGMLVEEQNEETGISCILVCPDGGRSVAVYRGASKMLTVDDIPWHRIDTDWLYISSLGGNTHLLAELLDYAHKNDIHVAANPGKLELQKLQPSDLKLLTNIDVLILNREEADLLTSANAIQGPRVCLITDGKNGGYITIDKKTEKYESKLVKTIEETGAGDAFGSGFVAAVMKGVAIPEALEWGKQQAASVVSYMGAKKGLLTLAQLNR